MMYLPDEDVQSLIFNGPIDVAHLNTRFNLAPDSLNRIGDFKDINWLNTPGPIYTTFTDNCGTGQQEAINNVGGDENYHEMIFKQPVNIQELKETITAAVIDPYGAYYFDGNLNWTADRVIAWWLKNEGRVNYIIDLYKKEIELPPKPHISSWKVGGKMFTSQLYGPVKPLPENYKAWLDFYQFGIEDYLEWYIEKVCGVQITLVPFVCDWTEKEWLDNLYQPEF